jgi:hypothetical protein
LAKEIAEMNKSTAARLAQNEASKKQALREHGSNTRNRLVAATADSECFDDLTWSNGVVEASFAKGGDYEYAMTREEAEEWFNEASEKGGDGLGKYFNEVIR